MLDGLVLFLPCAAGVESLLAQEARAIISMPTDAVQMERGGVRIRGSNWRTMLLLNLHSRIAQRVLIQLSCTPYAKEDDLYTQASNIAWEEWFNVRQTFKIDVTSQRSPLKSLNFAALRIKDAIADRFRNKTGARPSVDTHYPHVRIHAHLSAQLLTLYIDTSGEPLFKRGWRKDKGDAPLKETLAAAMIAATDWPATADQPLYDPCCGSGSIVIEAAQKACRIAPGRQRHFAFEHLQAYQSTLWQQLLQEARAAEIRPNALSIFGSDVSHRMVDFALRNAQRAGVEHAIQFRGGDALQRMPPTTNAGILLLNPPYDERIGVAGVAGESAATRAARAPSAKNHGRERAVMPVTENSNDLDFFACLASHWKAHYTGWQAWILSPNMTLPRYMRLQASRRVPLWNGPIECRLFCFDIVAGSPERNKARHQMREDGKDTPSTQPRICGDHML